MHTLELNTIKVRNTLHTLLIFIKRLSTNTSLAKGKLQSRHRYHYQAIMLLNFKTPASRNFFYTIAKFKRELPIYTHFCRFVARAR